MGDENGVAGEIEKAPHCLGRTRRAAQLLVAQAGDRRRTRRDAVPGIDERLELACRLEAADPDGADLADRRRPRPQPGRLEIDDHVRRLLEEKLASGRLCERDRVAVPGQARVGLDDLAQKRAGESDRSLAQREQTACRVLRGNWSAVLLNELHEPVGGV